MVYLRNRSDDFNQIDREEAAGLGERRRHHEMFQVLYLC